MVAGYTRPPGDRNDRGYSDDLWANCPREEIERDPTAGHFYKSDFVALPTGEWTLTGTSTAETFALVNGQGGLADLDCASSTDTQEGQIQLPVASFIPNAGSKIWFEARLKITDNAVGADTFIGLSEIDTTIMASSANTSANHIGWECFTNDGVLLFFGEKAGTRNSALASPKTLVDDTFVKLGFFVDGVSKVEHYVDGVKQGTTLAAANIPIVVTSPSFAVGSEGTTDPIMQLDWVEVYQEDRDV